MTRADGARMGLQARQSKARDRAARLRALVEDGAMVKQAAYAAGVSRRTASRYLGMVD